VRVSRGKLILLIVYGVMGASAFILFIIYMIKS
jgi:hypothetical protein